MSDVDDIKTRLDIVQVIGESVPLKKAGRNFKGLCPFHNEKTPSFMVNPERQSFHCFGCDEGGDLFDFVMKRERADFTEALRMLANRAGVELKGFDAKANKQKQRLFEANEAAARYFQAVLAHDTGKAARGYLKDRGLTEETLKQFRVGFAPDDFDTMVAALKKKDFTEQELVDAGLAAKGRGTYARFRGRVMIPITDGQGVIRGFTGRVLDPDAKEAKYVNTPETAIYHKGRLIFALDLAKEAIIGTDAAVLVEGQMDVLAAHQAGTKQAIAVSGTALTEEQLRQIARYAKTLVFALDADAAGRKAMLRAIELVGAAGLTDLELTVTDLGDAKDPDELIKQDPKAWERAVAEAQPVIDFLMARALAGHQPPYGRDAIRDVLDAVLPALRHRPGVDQDYYAGQLAMTLGVEPASIKEQLGKAGAHGTGAPSVRRPAKRDGSEKDSLPAPAQKTTEDLVSERMVGLALTTPAIGEKLAALDTRVFSGPYREAADALKVRYTKGTTSGSDPAEGIKPLLDVCALAAAEYDSMDERTHAAEFDRLYARLKALWVRRFQPRLMAAIKRAEASGETDRRNRLMQEYLSLSKHTVHG
ncbi:MAG: DNA primase [Patescibacteria group bacterium]